jgi:hypothetical protein
VEEQPSFDSPQTEATQSEKIAAFTRRMGRVLGGSLLGSTIYTAIIGPRSLRGFFDGLFFAGALLLVIAIMPLITEIFNRSTVTFGAKDRRLEDVLGEKKRQDKPSDTNTFLFGLGGILVIVLSSIIGLAVS